MFTLKILKIIVKYISLASISISAALIFNSTLVLMRMIDTKSVNQTQSPEWYAFYAIFIASLFEELIFRGLIYKGLYKLIKKPVIPILVSSFLFGIYHLNLPQFIYAFGMGLIFGFCYYKYKKIDVPYLMHVAANAATLFIPMLIPFNNVIAVITSAICTCFITVPLYILAKMGENENVKDFEERGRITDCESAEGGIGSGGEEVE